MCCGGVKCIFFDIGRVIIVVVAAVESAFG
jgi:hypothetical protein